MASVNSISSIPSPVYQCRNAFLLNIAVNCSLIPPKHLLNGSRVSNKCAGHLQSSRWNIANSRLDIVGYPFNKIGRVYILNVYHLHINFLGAHLTSEHGRGSQEATVAWSGSIHHVFGVLHLLGELWHS